MNTPENAVPESQRESRGETPAAAPATPAPRPLYWSLRRAVGEPIALHRAARHWRHAAARVLDQRALLRRSDRRRHGTGVEARSAKPGGKARQALAYDPAATLIIVTSSLVAVFYCLYALYGERRERSILFWKVLAAGFGSHHRAVEGEHSARRSAAHRIRGHPGHAVHHASDRYRGARDARHERIGAVAPGARVRGDGGPALRTCREFALVCAHLRWLLLVSAWARRTTFLWAVLPPLALCVVEAIAFHTWHLAALLKYRLGGGFAAAFDVTGIHGSFPNVGLAQSHPVKFLGTPGLWTGLAVAAAFLAGAVRLRRYRGPI